MFKIRFKETTKISGTTSDQSTLATVVGNYIKENIPKEAALSEVFETAKLAGKVKENIEREIQLESSRAFELDWKHNPKSIDHQLRYLHHQQFDYTLKVEYLSKVYKCLSLMAPKHYMLADVETGRIFSYEITHGCEAFLIEP